MKPFLVSEKRKYSVKNKYITAAAVCVLSLPLAVWAQQSEELRHPRPDGFQIGHRDAQGIRSIVEWVPRGETVHDWRRMVTVQTSPATNPQAFRQIMSGMWLKACPQGRATAVNEGMENGYPYVFWQLSCPLYPATGKPEITWVKAVGGQQRLYVAQYAFRYMPSEQEVRSMAMWMREVKVMPPKR